MACTQRALHAALQPSMAPSMTAASACNGVQHGASSGPVRVRTVRLSRRPGGGPGGGGGGGGGGGLGFSVRGGREHGTGFFVSAVEFASEAHLHGLKVGDQLLRINGFSLNQATHKEVLQLVSNQANITLKVKTVGVLPVKDKSNDPLTWRIVPDRPEAARKTQPPPPPPQQQQQQHGPPETTEQQLQQLHRLQQHLQMQHQHQQHQLQQHNAGDIVRMVIEVPPKAKLGCGICRGPDWRPGIFVQFTKEAGPAREAGLRPGDQLLQCNGTPFTDIPFSEAVAAMKASPTLDLLVRRGAGCDLFPGESSGYNSSASSVAGGESPSWDEPPPAATPAAPAANGHVRLAPLREEPATQGPQGHHVSTTGNLCTVIRLESPDNGWASGALDDVDATVSTASGRGESERTTVVVQVHRSEADDDEDASCCPPPPGPPGPPDPRTPGLPGPPGPPSPAPSSAASTSTSSTNSLSSAISQELQRRSEQRQAQGRAEAGDGSAPPPPPAPPATKPSPLASVLPVDAHKREQHERLMDEFRRAHRKMFAHAVAEANAKGAAKGPAPAAPAASKDEQERERFMQRRQQLEQQHAAQVSAGLALSAARERGLRVERDRQDSQEAEREVTRLVRRNGPRHPPPPPPEQPPQPAQSDAQAEGEVAVKEAVTPAPPAMPSSAAPSATLVPPPPAFTTVTLTGRTSPKAGKVLAKPPLPSSDVNGLNGVTNGINGNLKSAANGPVKSAVNGTVKSAVNGAVNGANMIAIQQARLKPVHHHLLHQHQQQQPPPQPLRVTHRTPSPAPHCPTPDYDSDSSGSTLHTASTAWTASPHQGVGAQQGPEVEMQSLDSLELLEPRARQPRPPQTYFQQNRAPAPPRPSVCVTIREYGGAASRPPSKLTFLNGQQQDGSGLQGELAATLSRSNLRTRADVVDGDAPAGEEASKSSDEVNRCNVTVTALNGGRAGADPYTSKCVVPNGILKKASVAHVAAGPVGHGLTPAILAGAGAALKTKSSGVATKTISFGAKATIINEKQIST